jgi:hypothetical protein
MNAQTHTFTPATHARPSWDRGDGYHANDPAAPDVWRCGGCDTIRPTEVCYCPECEGLTASYLVRQSDEPVLWLGSAWPQTEAF